MATRLTVTIQRWLTLGPGEHLELEAGENIDIVRQERANAISGSESQLGIVAWTAIH
jgi:hypothetical protein